MTGKQMGLFLAVTLVAACSTTEPTGKKPAAILAIVGTDTIRSNDLMNLLEKQNRKKVDVQSNEVRQGLLNNLVQNRLIYYYGLDNRLNEADEVRLEKSTRMDEMYYDKILKKYIYYPMISENDLSSLYGKLKSEVRVHQILISYKGAFKSLILHNQEPQRTLKDAKLLADSLYEAIKKEPQKFESIAEEFSDDPESKYLKGDIGYVRWGQRPGIEKTVFNLNAGEIAAPQETENGFLILRVTEKREVANLRSYDEAKNGLRDMMIPYMMHDRKTDIEAVKRKFTDSLLNVYRFETDKKNCDLFLKIYQTIQVPAGITTAFDEKESSLSLAAYKDGQVMISELVHVMKDNKKMVKLDSKLLTDGLKNVAARRIFSLLAQEERLELMQAEQATLKEVESERMIHLAIEQFYAKLAFDEKDIAAFFETNKEDYRERGLINIAEIASMDFESMNKIFQEIEKSKNFEAAFERASKSDKFVCKTTGLVLDDASDLLRQNARKVPTGGFSELFTKVNKETAILKVLERRQGAMPSYTSVQERVRQDYITFKKQISYDEWIAHLSLKYKVQIFSERLKEVFDIKLK
jgi:predicted DsbA family dithiol-disulfide isomerase